MSRMSSNDECPSGNFGDSLKLTNWILDSGAMCHMTLEDSDFIPGQLEDMEKQIEAADGNHVTSKKGQVQIKVCNNNGDPFIATLSNGIFAPYLRNRLFSITPDILVYSKRVFALCTSDQKRKMWLHYHIVHKGNMYFWEI